MSSFNVSQVITKCSQGMERYFKRSFLESVSSWVIQVIQKLLKVIQTVKVYLCPTTLSALVSLLLRSIAACFHVNTQNRAINTMRFSRNQ